MSFADILSQTYASFGGDNETAGEQCEPTISLYMFYQFSLIPAVIIYIILACMERRRHLLLHILNGRPGLVHPMDVLSRGTRVSYCCAFGAISSLCFKIVTESQYAFEYHGPTELKVFVIMLSILIYGISLSPMFVCLSVNTVLSFGLGTLYIWTYTGVKFFRLFECKYTPTITGFLVLRNLPEIIFLAYLACSFPVKFVSLLYVELSKRRTKENIYIQKSEDELVNKLRDSYHGMQMRKLLKRRSHFKKPPANIKEKIAGLICTVYHKLIYINEPGFRFSARILAVFTVGLSIVYYMTVDILVNFVVFFDLSLRSTENAIDTTVGWYATPGEDWTAANTRSTLYFTWYIFYCLKVCLIVSTVVATVIAIVMSLHSLCAYRTNLKTLHRGEHSIIPPLSRLSQPSLLAGSMRFAGYQVAYMTWGYVVQVLVLFLISLILAAFIVLMKEGIFTDYVVEKILKLWPAVVLGLVINFSQVLVSRFCFLQKYEGNVVLGMDNRRVLFLLHYFFYFYNIFLGMVSCLLRILKSMVIGTAFLSRLDISTLPRKFEALDPGFQAYIGFIHVENAHTHPGAIIFCRIMRIPVTLKEESLQMARQQPDVEMSEKQSAANLEKRRMRDRAINNWQLLYTLFNNPELHVLRKGYYQKKLKNPKLYREEYLKTFQDGDGLDEKQKSTFEPSNIMPQTATTKHRSLITNAAEKDEDTAL